MKEKTNTKSRRIICLSQKSIYRKEIELLNTFMLAFCNFFLVFKSYPSWSLKVERNLMVANMEDVLRVLYISKVPPGAMGPLILEPRFCQWRTSGIGYQSHQVIRAWRHVLSALTWSVAHLWAWVINPLRMLNIPNASVHSDTFSCQH